MILVVTNSDGKQEIMTVNACMILDTSAIADGDLPTGCCQFWRDEVNHKIMVKTKYQDDAVKTSTLCDLT